jgi:cell division septal protein FtsQ
MKIQKVSVLRSLRSFSIQEFLYLGISVLVSYVCILATWEAEIRKIVVRGQLRQIVHKAPS